MPFLVHPNKITVNYRSWNGHNVDQRLLIHCFIQSSKPNHCGHVAKVEKMCLLSPVCIAIHPCTNNSFCKKFNSKLIIGNPMIHWDSFNLATKLLEILHFCTINLAWEKHHWIYGEMFELSLRSSHQVFWKSECMVSRGCWGDLYPFVQISYQKRMQRLDVE